MKEDILEQLVDGYLLRKKSTFTKHNVKYKPNIPELDKESKNKYSVASDIDVLAIHLNKAYEERVSVVSCKSWQGGFDVDFFYSVLQDSSRREKKNVWKKFRELVNPIWAKAFIETIYAETGWRDFTYYVAVTKLKTQKSKHLEDFQNCELFLNNLSDNGKNKVKIKLITLEEIIKDIFADKPSTTLEPTEIGRFIQLIKAAGLDIK